MNNTLELLKENPRALQFLHALEGYDFTKTYVIIKGYGRFTHKTVMDAVHSRINADFVATLLIKPDSYINESLHYAVVLPTKLDAAKRDIKSYQYNIDYFFGVGDFEDTRKHKTKYYYIIAQKLENLANIPTPKTIDKTERVKPYFNKVNYYYSPHHKSSFISSIPVMLLDGSAYKTEIHPNGHYTLYSQYKNPEDIIDKSGYFVKDIRENLKRRAAALRIERERAAVMQANFITDENQINTKIKNAKNAIWEALQNAETDDDVRTVSKFIDILESATRAYNRYKNDKNNSKLNSISDTRSRFEYIESKLDCIVKWVNYNE